MQRRRVAVTGLGAICALGNNVAEMWRAVCAGQSAIAPWQPCGCITLRPHSRAEVRGFDPAAHFSPGRLRMLDRFSQLGAVAAREAVEDSGIAWSPTLREQTAIVTGTGLGGQGTLDAGFAKLYGHSDAKVEASIVVPRTMANAAAGQISMEFGITGPVFTASTACCSSNHAIGQAFRLIRDGYAELAITGGSEAPFSRGVLKAFEAMRIVSPDTCRPFSKDRRGLVLAEGAAMLVLEPMVAAIARNAHVYAELIGFGMSGDAQHFTHLSADGPRRAMQAALKDAALEPEEVDYINAHGSGTVLNDAQETRAIRELFGDHAARLAISSTKSIHGHALGGTGALEAVCTVLALEHGVLPPTVNYTEPDPACDLDVVPNHARTARLNVALSNSFAFGGLNAVLAFRSQTPAA